MYAMASLGRMNLVGLIVTPVLTDFWTFPHPDWVDTAHDSRNNALASGIDPDCLPPITVGTEAESEQAGENKLSEGAELYVKLINENYAKHPDRPMIINIGGQGRRWPRPTGSIRRLPTSASSTIPICASITPLRVGLTHHSPRTSVS